MPLDMIDQVRIDRIDRIEKRLSAVTVSMITVQAMVLGLADEVGQMDAQAAKGVRAAVEAWGEVLSDSEVSELKPVVEAMDTLLRKHGA